MDAHSDEEQAGDVARGQLSPPGNGAHGRDSLDVAKWQQPERGTDDAEEGREDDEPLRTIEAADSIACSCHEQRWMHHRHLTHVMSRRGCPLSTGTTSCRIRGHPPGPASRLCRDITLLQSTGASQRGNDPRTAMSDLNWCLVRALSQAVT